MLSIYQNIVVTNPLKNSSHAPTHNIIILYIGSRTHTFHIPDDGSTSRGSVSPTTGAMAPRRDGGW